MSELLEADVVDVAESHSRSSLAKATSGTVWDCFQGLGARRLWNFRAIHFEELSALIAKTKGAEKGRALRLLGEGEKAQAELEAALKANESSRAAGWLGELLLLGDRKKALVLLEKAAALDPKWPWPRLWLALARADERSWKPALAELDRAAGLSYAEFPVRFHLALRAKDQKAAEDAARRAIDLDRGCPAGHNLLSRARLAVDDVEGAADAFHAARDLDMDVEGSAYFEHLGARIDWSSPAEYLKSLDKAIAKRPDAVLYAERAELKRDPRLCRYEEALADYAKAAELAPRRAWIAAVLGRARNNYLGGEAGIAEFDRALALRPDSGWMYAWRGAALARLGRQEKALSDFNRSEELMPWHSFTYAWRGALFNRLRRFPEAARDLERAVRLDPHYNFSYFERFLARAGLKDFERAVEDLNLAFAKDPKYSWGGQKPTEKSLSELDEAVAKFPANHWLAGWRGRTLFQLGRAREAVDQLGKAIAGGAKSALLHSWRAEAALALGDGAAALEDLTRAVKLDPAGWPAYKTMTDLHLAAGRPEKALESIRKATELAPTTVSHFLQRATIARALKKTKEALEALDRASQLDPSFAQAHILAAQIRLERGELAEASAAVERALASANPPGQAYLVRALIRERTGDAAGQIEDFKKALAIAPELFPEKERKAVEGLIKGASHV